MGRHHARVLRAHPEVEFVAAVNPFEDLSKEVAGVPVLDSVGELLERGIDICVIAAPTTNHEEIAIELAEARVATLVEKPLAHSTEAAKRIVKAFAARNIIGCVGHIERFNPALQQLRRRLDLVQLDQIWHVASRRQGPFPVRAQDCGVILDLATHDIDLTSWLTGSPYRSVSARSVSKSGQLHEDLVTVTAELANGTVVTHLVNRLLPFKERVFTVSSTYGCFVADTVTASLVFHHNSSSELLSDHASPFPGVSEGAMTRFAFPTPEPLVTELTTFFAAVRGDQADVATLEEGLRTIQVAEAIRDSAVAGETIEVSCASGQLAAAQTWDGRDGRTWKP